jgi:hypothetical protein
MHRSLHLIKSDVIFEGGNHLANVADKPSVNMRPAR